MDLGIAGRHALVLGGTRGLGFACAHALAAEGVHVTMCGRDRESGGKALALLGEGHAFIEVDLADEAARQRLYDDVSSGPLPPTLLVNNAGGPPTGEFTEQALATWRAAFELNVLAFIHTTQTLLPAMRDAGFGRVVNITSFAAREPYPNMALANALRVAVHGAMSTLAREVAHQGITVNNLLPGLMDTGALERVIDARSARDAVSPETVRRDMAASIPAQRLGTAEDFGAACAFLCSTLAGYITAQSLLVDGGLVRALD